MSQVVSSLFCYSCTHALIKVHATVQIVLANLAQILQAKTASYAAYVYS